MSTADLREQQPDAAMRRPGRRRYLVSQQISWWHGESLESTSKPTSSGNESSRRPMER
jgi:hypothetical protein